MSRTGLAGEAGAAAASSTSADRRDPHTTFLRRLAGTLGSRAVAFVVAAGISVVTARLLGPAGQGTYSVLMTIGLLGVQLGALGLTTSSAYHGGAVRASVRRLAGFVLLFALSAGVGLGGGLVLIEAVSPWLLPLEGLGQSMLVALYLPLGLLAVLVQAILLGRGQVAWYNGLEVGQAAITLAALGAVALAATATPEGFYAIAVVATGGAALVGLLALLRGTGRPSLPDRTLVRGLLRYGARSYLANLFSFVVLYIDLLMVAAVLGDRAAGLYAIATRVAEWVYALPVAAGAMLFTGLMEQDPSEQRAFTLNILRWAVLAMPPILLAVGLLAPWLVELLYGGEFLPGLAALYWLLPAVLALGLHTLVMNHLAATGMPLVAVAAPAVGAPVNVALNLWLLPLLGIRGAAIASMVAYGAMLSLSLGWLLVRGDRARPGQGA